MRRSIPCLAFALLVGSSCVPDDPPRADDTGVREDGESDVGADTEADTENNGGDTADASQDASDAGATLPSTLRAAIADYYAERRELRVASSCEFYWNCKERTQRVSTKLRPHQRYDTVDECKTKLADDWPRLQELEELPSQKTERTVELVREGRAEFDGEAAQTCLDTLRDLVQNRPCQARQTPPVCDRVLVGQVEEGEPCVRVGACKPGLRCVGEQGDDVCHGWCEPVGEPAERLEEGDSCAPSAEADCGYGLTCEYEKGTARSENVCVPMGSRGEGEVCRTAFGCKPGLTCTEDQVCQPVAFLGQGASCDWSTRRCKGNLHCLETLSPGSTGGECASIGKDGEQCLHSAQCHMRTFCDRNGDGVSTCSPVTPLGGPCRRDEECAGRIPKCVQTRGEPVGTCEFRSSGVDILPEECPLPGE